jgi:hypothetical protein
MSIPHVEATHKIYFTRDYTRFKNIIGNRLLNESKIKRIIKDIENGLDILKYCPIIVDTEMNVIDGQHRLYVARTIKSNIWYVISESLSLSEIAKINSNTERWKAKDFIHCYSAQGNADYDKLRNYLDEYHFPLSISLKLLCGNKTSDGGAGMRLKQLFEAGEFKIKTWDKAIAIAMKVNSFAQFESRKTRPFIDAIARLIENGKCDFEHLLKKYEANPDALKPQPDTKSYLRNLEEIYNLNQRSRTVIF